MTILTTGYNLTATAWTPISLTEPSRNVSIRNRSNGQARLHIGTSPPALDSDHFISVGGAGQIGITIADTSLLGSGGTQYNFYMRAHAGPTTVEVLEAGQLVVLNV